MNINAIAFAVLLAISNASAQTLAVQNAGRVFGFTSTPNPHSLQEVVEILRTIGDTQDLSVDTAAATITVHGDAGQLALAGWLIQSLDVPRAAQTTASAGGPEYEIPGDGVVKVFYLAKPASPQQIQEVLAVLRVVVDAQKVLSYSAQDAIVVRCNRDKMKLVENLFDDLDRRYWIKPVVKIFYLSNPATPEQIRQIVAVFRAVAGVQRAFGLAAHNSIGFAVRCDPDRVTLVEKLFSDLDKPAATN